MTRGAQLLREFLEAGHTQAEVAEMLTASIGHEVHQSTVSGWVAGRHIPHGRAMVALRDIAGISVESWLQPERKSGEHPSAFPSRRKSSA
jgi:hypothetical protein